MSKLLSRHTVRAAGRNSGGRSRAHPSGQVPLTAITITESGCVDGNLDPTREPCCFM